MLQVISQSGSIIPHSGHIHTAGSRSYLFDINEQTRQDSFRTGNSILKRLKQAYNNIITNAAPNRYAPDSRWHCVFPPVASMIFAHPEGIITKSKKSMAMEITMMMVVAIITQNGGRASSDITVF